MLPLFYSSMAICCAKMFSTPVLSENVPCMKLVKLYVPVLGEKLNDLCISLFISLLL